MIKGFVIGIGFGGWRGAFYLHLFLSYSFVEDQWLSILPRQKSGLFLLMPG